jgi:hypothetical protein
MPHQSVSRYAAVSLMTLLLTTCSNGGGARQAPGGWQAQSHPRTVDAPASITGRVAAEDDTSIASAEILVQNEGELSRRTTTDESGHYAFRHLSPGRYRVRCQKAGFVPAEWGRVSPFEQGKEVALSAGHHVDAIDFRLERAGVITGRVVDERGEPVVGTWVNALRLIWNNGRRLDDGLSRGGITDDRGRYRIHGMPKGRYFLRGRLDVGVHDDERPQRRFWASTYYPGTVDAGQAAAVPVEEGRETSRGDLTLHTVAVTHVSGILRRSDGKPVFGFVGLHQRPSWGGRGPLAWGSGGAGRLQPDGRFSIDYAEPGDYLLLAMTMRRPLPPRSARPAEDSDEWALVPVHVGGIPVENVRVATARNTTVSGRVVFEAGVTQRPRRSSTYVRALSLDVAFPYPARFYGPIRDDWTFVLDGLIGARVLGAFLPPGWAVSSVRCNGRDMTETAFEFGRPDRIDGVEILLTNRITHVQALATDRQGHHVGDYTAVVFPQDPGHWAAVHHRLFQTYGRVISGKEGGQPLSPAFRTARAGQDGRIVIEALPPGRYLAAAVPTLEEGEWMDEDWLRQLAPSAMAFSLAAGERKELVLSLARQ